MRAYIPLHIHRYAHDFPSCPPTPGSYLVCDDVSAREFGRIGPFCVMIIYIIPISAKLHSTQFREVKIRVFWNCFEYLGNKARRAGKENY